MRLDPNSSISIQHADDSCAAGAVGVGQAGVGIGSATSDSTRALSILCEIHAPRSAQAAALAEIATVCARDVGQPLTVRALTIGKASAEPVLTLHLPVELAVEQHRVWCLACRLACFCPTARVSVLVSGESAFLETSARRRRSA